MSQPTPPSTRNDRLLTCGIILAAMAGALAIRIIWPYGTVFVDGNVWFREMDSWYRMRLVDNFIQNFPHVTAFDPYSFFPNGIKTTFHPLTSWLIALPALVLGGGHPSPALIDACGAYFPPVLGALTVVPVYFIGRHLYGRIAGATAAILIAILPGEFLSRSLLGFTDHHVTEAFFSTVTLLLLMYALRQADSASVVIGRLSDALAPAYRRTVMFAVLAGVSLGLYLLAWRGGVFVLAILVVYMVIRCLTDYRHGLRGDDLVLVFPVAGAVALLMASPTIAAHFMKTLYVTAMASVIVVPIALRLFGALGRRMRWSPGIFTAALAGVLGLAFLAVVMVTPVLADYIVNAIDFMVPTGAHLSIMEMHPLFFPGGTFSLTVAWTNYTTALAASLIALVMLIRSHRRPRGNDVTLLLVWSITMLAAVLLQRRFGYYYSVSTAVLCGFLVAWLLTHPWVKSQLEIIGRRMMVPAKAKSKAAVRVIHSHQAERRNAMLRVATLVIVIVALLVVPSVDMARNFATEPGLMTAGWYETLVWLRDNTPEPLEPQAYYGMHAVPAAGQRYSYPSTAYGIMAWWDYGHWITRVSHRIPVANPFQQGARAAGRFFMSQDEAAGSALMDELGCGYVVVDSKTSVNTFHGVAGWAGQERSDFIEVYYQRNSSGSWESISLFYPEYYQTMLVRLYNFGGKAYEPSEFTVIRYQEGRSSGRLAKEIVEVQRFPTYDEALSFLSQSAGGNWRLVGTNPMESAVPLAELQGFSIEFESTEQAFIQAELLPEVRVFRYSGEHA
jgi:oligosaccharyl transferase (archaeosortase A-associated)